MGRDAAAQFVERHTGLLDTAAGRYDGVMDRIAGDEALAAYLASQIVGAG